MTANSSILTSTDPTEVYLEIPPSDRAEGEDLAFSNPHSRWNAHLNRLCLSAILPWLQEEYDSRSRVYPNLTTLPSYWEFANGTAISCGGMRLVFIPGEAIDLSELRVPQEWIDIPSWIADYYLAVQVEPDEGWVRIWGYATHEQLKTTGTYDSSDRTYSLDREDLIADINVLWVARQLCPDETTQAAIAPLSSLSLVQADNLLQRLSNASEIEPQLAIPFTLWGALLEHPGWRQKLYQQRLGIKNSPSVLQWLQDGVSEMARQIGWQRLRVQPELGGARGSQTEERSEILSRQLTVADRPYELRIIPIDLERRIWRFELRNALLGGSIPIGMRLTLLSEDLQPFDNNQDIAETEVDRLYVEVAVEPGEALVWEIAPHPDDWEREILRLI